MRAAAVLCDWLSGRGRCSVCRAVGDDLAGAIDGPLAHLPSGRFGANSAWILCAAIAHNLLRAAGVLAGDRHTRARPITR
jgi:hypothetical protein